MIPKNRVFSPRLLWVVFFSSALLYLSLWVVQHTAWHLTVSAGALGLLLFRARHPLRQILYIVGLVLFLLLLQIAFSPYIKALFFRTLQEWVNWQEWAYLLKAIERFLLPLAIVTSFHRELTKPAVMAQLSELFSPLKWVGVKTNKLQMLLVLSLKFMPALRIEWERFNQLQSYFVAKLPRRTWVQRLTYWQGVLKAMISHIIHQAVITGDLLALRGMPEQIQTVKKTHLVWSNLLWLFSGLTALMLDQVLFSAWLAGSFWLLLTSLAQHNVETS